MLPELLWPSLKMHRPLQQLKPEFLSREPCSLWNALSGVWSEPSSSTSQSFHGSRCSAWTPAPVQWPCQVLEPGQLAGRAQNVQADTCCEGSRRNVNLRKMEEAAVEFWYKGSVYTAQSGMVNPPLHKPAYGATKPSQNGSFSQQIWVE